MKSNQYLSEDKNSKKTNKKLFFRLNTAILNTKLCTINFSIPQLIFKTILINFG